MKTLIDEDDDFIYDDFFVVLTFFHYTSQPPFSFSSGDYVQ